MTLNRVNLGRAVTFIKYFDSVVSLIFVAKPSIWNKITFPASHLLNLAELVVNEHMKSIYKIFYPYSFFYSIYYCLKQRLQKLTMQEQDIFKNLHQCCLWLIINYQSSIFGGEGSWNENVKNGLKVESPLKFKWFFIVR